MRDTLRFTPALVLSLTAALASTGCAKDPAAEATSAEVRDVDPAPAQTEAPAAGETLAFSNATSKIEWTGSKVTGSHDGGFRDFEGTITLDPADLTASGVEVAIQTASLYSDTDKLTQHLTTADFFEVERFPTATFRSTAIAEGGRGDATHTVTGTLTLHGVTKEVSFPATIRVTGDQATAKAEFSIDRNDWGLTYPGKPDDLIRDGVVIRLDLRAPRRAES